MMKNNLIKLKLASFNYRLNYDYEITENLFKYIQERIAANKEEIEKLIKIKNENITYYDLENAIKNEINQEILYKDYKNMVINKEKFIFASMLMPIGIIAVEAFDTIQVVKFFIKAIKSRNAIAISDVEYDEQSTKFLILEIIKEALRKFNIDSNLIMILPYEECFYEYFDKTIYTYDKSGITFQENLYETKALNDKKYIYIEDKELEEIALKDNIDIEKEILYGNVDEIIEKINTVNPIAVAIYTKNSENAYKFLNLVRSQNILVNASLQNTKAVKESPNELYEYRNIILPIPQNETKEPIEPSEDQLSKIELENNYLSQELTLETVNNTILDRIKNFLKKFFK